MTKTSYILSNSTLNESELDFISDNFENIFDIIIDKKLKISLLKMGLSNSNLFRVERFINILKQTNLDKRDYLYTPDILTAFSANKSSVIKIKNDFDENLMDIIKKIYSGNLYISSTKLLSRIMNSCDNFIEEIKNDNNYIKELIIFYIFYRRRISTDVFYDEVEKYLSKIKINIPNDFNLIGTVIELIQEGYIHTEWGEYVFPSNVFYKQSLKENADSFKDYLRIEFSDKNILKELFSGTKIDSLANDYGQSVKEIKQILNRYLFIFKDTYEYKTYVEIFEKYDFSKNDFKYLFDENDETYNFLVAICHRGNKKLTYTSIMSDDLFSKMKVPMEKTGRFLINEQSIDNDEVKNNLELFIENHKDIIFRNETLFGMYNHYASPENKMSSVKDVEGIISHSRYVISPQYRKFRFYDFNKNNKYIPIVQELINELPPGNYSTYKIFTEYPELMSDMDIRNAYELYNFMSKNSEHFKEIAKLAKAPTFYVQFSSKREFIEKELLKFNGDNKVDFVQCIHEKFGLSVKKLSAYLDFNFSNYDFTKKDIINNDNGSKENIDYSTFDLIKGKLTEPIYSQEKFEKVVNAHTKLNDYIVNELNYKKKGDVYFSKKFYSLTDALVHLISESDFENKLYNKIIKSSTVRSCLHGLQRDFRVFQLEEGMYCTMDYMKETGIDIFTIKSFVRTVKRISRNYDFFSIHYLFNDINDDKLVDYCFDEIFYDDIINYSNSFNVVKKLISKGERIYSSKNYKLDDFIRFELDEFDGKCDIDDFIDSITNKYRIYISKDTVIDHVQYYAKNLEMIYNNKEEYYNDIYGG
ncbi:hypothetical protein RZ77_05690 [Apilactobacillus kunkeei]|uniref:hypothetical protein n=1 Tax=Apilactobacillus kunkeei TaxID=148814 RepID=UPI0006CE7093|nr:hypothetical protein [Apilactobacillus kunkeei]KPN83949.1 hypothetical protein RZ77_05690 [Apilactobacillus kunkeei]MCK8636077.1 hypothetical protein [Apilactobacillus kunkeei]